MVKSLKTNTQVVTPEEVAKDFQLSQVSSSALSNSPNLLKLNSLTTYLGQIGLKDAAQVVAFLKSPNGLKTKGLIHKQLSLLQQIKENLVHYYLEAHLRKFRIMAFLHMIAVYKKEARGKALNAAAQQQINKILAQQQKNLTAKRAAAAEGYYSDFALPQTALVYQLTSQMIEHSLAEKLEEAKQLEEALIALELEGQEISKRYEILNDFLDKFDSDYQLFQQRNQKSTLEAKLTDLQTMMALAQQSIDAKRVEINALLGGDKNEELATLLYQLNGLNAHLIGFEDVLAELEGRKFYYNLAGQRVDSYGQADYILANTERVFVDPESGVTYLLVASPHLDEEDLQNLFKELNTEDKQQAQQKFEQTKPDILSLRQLATHSKMQEQSLHQQNQKSLLERSEQLQEEILDLMTQDTAIKPLMNQLTMGAPTPSPSPSPLKKAPSSEEIHQQTLRLMRFNLTQKAIDRFVRFFSPDASEKPKSEAKKLISQELIPGMPIPETTMNSLLRNLSRMDVSPNKPNVTSVPDKTPSKEMKSSTAPTPFKKTPF